MLRNIFEEEKAIYGREQLLRNIVEAEKVINGRRQMRKFETVEVDLSEEEQLEVVNVLFEVDSELLKDLQQKHEDIKDVIYHLVLSQGVTEILLKRIKEHGQ